MAADNNKKEELIAIDPDEKGSPEHSQEDYPQIHSQTCQLEAKSLGAPPPTSQGVDPEVASEAASKETTHDEYPLQKYFGAAEAAWHTWLKFLSKDASVTGRPHFGDIEGRVSLSGQSTGKTMARMAFGLLFCRVLVTVLISISFVTIYDISSWIWHTFAYETTLLTGIGIVLIVFYLVATRMLATRTQPHSWCRVIVSGLLSLTASVYFAICVICMRYHEGLAWFSLGVIMGLSLVMWLYVSQSKIDFTLLRAIVLCTVIVDVAFLIAYVGNYYLATGLVVSAALAVVFSIYLVYDTYFNLLGIQRYSLIRLLASQCPKFSTTHTDDQEDQTAICPQQDEPHGDIPNANSHGGFHQANLLPQTGWKTWITGSKGDEKYHKAEESKVPIDETQEDECNESTRVKFISRAFTILIYQLLVTKYVLGVFGFEPDVHNWARFGICLPCSGVQLFLLPNILIGAVVLLYKGYNTRHQAPKRWLISLGICWIVGNVYLGLLFVMINIDEVMLVAVPMCIFVSVALMEYVSRKKGNYNGLVASLISVYVIQACLVICYFTLRYWDMSCAVWGALLALAPALYLVHDARDIVRGRARWSLLRLLGVLHGAKPPANTKHVLTEGTKI